MKQRKYAMPMYVVIQILYFIVQAIIANYATIFMLDRGMSTTWIGVFYAVNSILVMIGLMGGTALVKNTKLNLSKLSSICYVVLAALSFVLWKLQPEGVLFVVLFTIIFMISNIMYTYVNAVYRGYHDSGTDMHYSFARGMGSASFTAATYAAGLLLANVAPRDLPLYYIVPALLLAIVFWIFNAPDTDVVAADTEVENTKSVEANAANTKDGSKKKISLIKEYPHFIWFVVGVGFIERASQILGTYMIFVVERVSGNASQMGIALALGTVTELPAMLIYPKISKKVGNRRLLLIAAWVWAFKVLLLLCAPNMFAIYLIQLSQFFGAAIYLPAAAKHLAHVLPKEEFLHGQTVVGIFASAGGLVGSILGAYAIDRVGIYPVMVVLGIAALFGAVIVSFTIKKSLKLIPSVKRDIPKTGMGSPANDYLRSFIEKKKAANK